MLKDVLEMLGKLLVWWVVAFLFFGLLIMQCSKEAEANVTITDVIDAIEEVESNRDPYAINAKENALGCLQIRPIMIADYNRITKENLSHDVAYNRAMAYIIASTIFNHYMKGIENPNANTAWLAFPILIKKDAPFSRKEFQIYLEKRNIQTRVVFTGNILRQPMCKNIDKKINITKA